MIVTVISKINFIMADQIQAEGSQEKKKGLSEMTRAEFEAVPELSAKQWREHVKDFDSLVILPRRRLHDSGYRCMAFVACKGDEPIVKLGGGSDVIHIEGIGGYGYNWLARYITVPQLVKPVSWSVDCLKTSGLLRLFAHENLIADGHGFSSFELYSDPEGKIRTISETDEN